MDAKQSPIGVLAKALKQEEARLEVNKNRIKSLQGEVVKTEGYMKETMRCIAELKDAMAKIRGSAPQAVAEKKLAAPLIKPKEATK